MKPLIAVGDATLLILFSAVASSATPHVGVAGTATGQMLHARGSGVSGPIAASTGAAADMLAGSSRWRLTKPAMRGEIEGYTTRVSARSGDEVPLRVSTGAGRFRVEAYRFGAYSGGDGRLIWSSGWVKGSRQAAPVFGPYSMRTVVAPWRRSLVLPTLGWPEGAYVLKLLTGTGWQSHVPFFVRSANSTGKVALVAPVATWQAYNTWGGYDLYQGEGGDRRAWAVSFDRPYPAPGAEEMLFGARSLVVRAERLGIPLAYFTNVDIAGQPDLLSGARGYVSLGHDEYWTLSMRRAVLLARRSGTNLAFFGANTMYWRIRLEESRTGPNRVVVGYRSDAYLDPMRSVHPALTTARYRDEPVAKAENKILGMLYECFPVDAPYRVVAPGWWGFSGTGVTKGAEFEHLVGVEADRVYPDASMPSPLQILSYARYSCRGIDTSTESVYYTTPSGAGVFAVGTLRWTCALTGYCRPYAMPQRTVAFVRRVTNNVLRDFAIGPSGLRHPARDNVAEFNLPEVNQVPAS